MVYTTKLLKKEEVARNTTAFHLLKPEGFSFKAGQHIDLAVENPNQNDNLGASRTLSIVSAPHEEEIVVATRNRDTAFKRELHSPSIERQGLSIDGPFGSMTLHSRSELPAIFLAGGIGITPFVSLIRQAVYENSPHRINLFYSNRRHNDAAFLDEIKNIFKVNENFQLITAFTKEGDGHISQELIKNHVSDISQSVFYISGPPRFVRSMQDLLESIGVEEDDIRFEEFAGY